MDKDWREEKGGRAFGEERQRDVRREVHIEKKERKKEGRRDIEEEGRKEWKV